MVDGPNDFSWYASCYGICWDIFCDYGVGCYYCAFPYVNARHN